MRNGRNSEVGMRKAECGKWEVGRRKGRNSEVGMRNADLKGRGFKAPKWEGGNER